MIPYILSFTKVLHPAFLVCSAARNCPRDNCAVPSVQAQQFVVRNYYLVMSRMARAVRDGHNAGLIAVALQLIPSYNVFANQGARFQGLRGTAHGITFGGDKSWMYLISSSLNSRVSPTSIFREVDTLWTMTRYFLVSRCSEIPEVRMSHVHKMLAIWCI